MPIINLDIISTLAKKQLLQEHETSVQSAITKAIKQQNISEEDLTEDSRKSLEEKVTEFQKNLSNETKQQFADNTTVEPLNENQQTETATKAKNTKGNK